MEKRNVIILFVVSVIGGYAIWQFSPFIYGIREPWDAGGQPGYLLTLGALGFAFGISVIERPWIWPVGIYIGQFLWCMVDFVAGIVSQSGVGANFFIPLGAIFLLIYSFPAFAGSYLGFFLRKVILPPRNPGVASKYAALNKGRDKAPSATSIHDGVPAGRTRCDLCGTVFPSQYYLRAAGSRGYVCVECSKKA